MLSLDDIQGTLLRGYSDPRIRFLLLRIDDPAGARELCRRLLPGSGSPLTITTAQPWGKEKPPCLVTLGLTSGGLRKLIGADGYATVRDNTAGDYFTPFDEGAESRASRVGDVGVSAPQNWWKNGGARLPGPPSAGDLDLLIALYTQTPQDRETFSEKLLGMIPPGADGKPAAVVAFVQDSDALSDPGSTAPSRRIHFGYTDGISQPRLQDSPGHDAVEPIAGDERPGVPVSFFVMNRPAFIHSLLANGSYAAFRILYQDAAAFQASVHAQGLDPGLAAAKMCGRWLNGTPLVVSPDKPLNDLSENELENFKYLDKDRAGLRCPFASHIRRTNPRDDTSVKGNELYPDPSSQIHRILRRAGPYGPEYSASTADAQRGLAGLFIGAKLGDQFEFVMGTWVGQGGFRKGLPAEVDPLFAPDALGSPQSLIRTDGALYLFLPGIAGLAQIAQGRVTAG